MVLVSVLIAAGSRRFANHKYINKRNDKYDERHDTISTDLHRCVLRAFLFGFDFFFLCIDSINNDGSNQMAILSDTNGPWALNNVFHFV